MIAWVLLLSSESSRTFTFEALILCSGPKPSIVLMSSFIADNTTVYLMGTRTLPG